MNGSELGGFIGAEDIERVGQNLCPTTTDTG
jgi:hypothetical protein